MSLNEDIEKEIIKDFHSQFAQNQNHHQALMFQFFAGFVAMLVVYAYATLNVVTYLKRAAQSAGIRNIDEIIKTNKFVISEEFYFKFSVIISYVFVYMFLYICQVAYAYRRDLKVVRKIRERYCLNSYQIFSDYGSNNILFLWPPDFFAVMMFGILLLTTGIGIWVHYFTVGKNYHFCYFIPQLIIILLCYCAYWYKYKKRCVI